jgi:membrane-associated protease RseP (regulator of RpoE activity)
VRSVEKGSRGEKAGFRAGDVVVKVNSQPVHDTSDFTHALRSSASGTAAVTVMRDKKEQNLTLTLPEKKDTGSMQQEDTFDIRNFTAQTEQAISRASQIAQLAPSIEEAQRVQEQAESCQQERQKELQQELQDQQEEMREQAQERQQQLRQELQERQDELQDQAQEMQERQQELQEQQQERQEEIRLQPPKKLADI